MAVTQFHYTLSEKRNKNREKIRQLNTLMSETTFKRKVINEPISFVTEWVDRIGRTHDSVAWRPRHHHRWTPSSRAQLRELLLIAKLYESPNKTSPRERVAVHAGAYLHLLPEELLQLLYSFVAPPLIAPCSDDCVWASQEDIRLFRLPRSMHTLEGIANDFFMSDNDTIEDVLCDGKHVWDTYTIGGAVHICDGLRHTVTHIESLLLAWATRHNCGKESEHWTKKAQLDGLLNIHYRNREAPCSRLSTRSSACTAQVVVFKRKPFAWEELPGFIHNPVCVIDRVVRGEKPIIPSRGSMVTTRSNVYNRTGLDRYKQAEKKRKKAEKLKWKKSKRRRKKK